MISPSSSSTPSAIAATLPYSPLAWLQPPYLYLVINCIIIVASSKLQSNKVDGVEEYSPTETLVVVPPVPVKVEPVDYAAAYCDDVVVVKGEGFDVSGGMESDKTMTTTLVLDAADDEVAVPTSLGTTQVNYPATEYLVSSNERLPVSGRIGHRKGVKSSP